MSKGLLGFISHASYQVTSRCRSFSALSLAHVAYCIVPSPGRQARLSHSQTARHSVAGPTTDGFGLPSGPQTTDTSLRSPRSPDCARRVVSLSSSWVPLLSTAHQSPTQSIHHSGLHPSAFGGWDGDGTRAWAHAILPSRFRHCPNLQSPVVVRAVASVSPLASILFQCTCNSDFTCVSLFCLAPLLVATNLHQNTPASSPLPLPVSPPHLCGSLIP